MARIRHIVFHTTDVERLAKFYVDVMGLKIVHRAKNGGISLTDGYMNLSIHTNKMDGKPSGFNHFGFVVEDNAEIAERCQQLGYRAPLRRPCCRVLHRIRQGADGLQRSPWDPMEALRDPAWRVCEVLWR